MIRRASRIQETGPDIILLQVWIVFKDLALGHTFGEHAQNIRHPDSHSSNASPAATLFGVESYSIQKSPAHGKELIMQSGPEPI
jgi:hypothetical protein